MSVKITEGKGSIVATLGPASSNPKVLSEMIENGLDIIRLNMSHGTVKTHKENFEMIRDLNDKIPILIDLSGPKIRIGKLENAIELSKGDTIKLTKENIIGNKEKISITYPELIDLAQISNTIYLNDGLIELKVEEKSSKDLLCKVIAGGTLTSRKGLNVPEVPIKLYAPTDKDLQDLDKTIDLEPDFYSVSFVRRAEDLRNVRDRIATHTENKIPLVSKIEHQDALDNIDPITRQSNVIMVARGDLGVELPPENIPLIQQSLVQRCNELGTPCIVATQMLESMVLSSKPTRAEASDVANAILQGADAVMLSAETATGEYPVETVSMMDRIIKTVQHNISNAREQLPARTVPDSIGRSAVSLASSLDTDVIMAFTRSGGSSAAVAKFRPNQPIIAVTPLIQTARRIRIQWSVTPLLLNRDFTDTDEMIYQGVKTAFEYDLIEKQDTAVVVAGSLLGLPASTNLVQFLRIGDIIESAQARERFAQAYSLSPNHKNN